MLAMFVFSTLFTGGVSANTNFPDVPEGHEYAWAINYLVGNGMVSGYQDGLYRPEREITRAEFTKITISAKYDSADIDTCLSSVTEDYLFPDIHKDDKFASWICVAKRDGVIKGYSTGFFGSGDLISFPESAKIIARTFELGTFDVNDLLSVYIQKLIDLGYIPGTITDPETTQTLTRGEMAYLIARSLGQLPPTVPGITLESLGLPNGEVRSYSKGYIAKLGMVHEGVWVGNKGYVRNVYVDGSGIETSHESWTEVNVVLHGNNGDHVLSNHPTNATLSQSLTVIPYKGFNGESVQGVWALTGDGTIQEGFTRHNPLTQEGGLTWNARFYDRMELKNVLNFVNDDNTRIQAQSSAFLGISTGLSPDGSAIPKGLFYQDVWIDNVRYSRIVDIDSSGNIQWGTAPAWQSVSLAELGLPNGDVKGVSKYIISGNPGQSKMIDSIWIDGMLYTITTLI